MQKKFLSIMVVFALAGCGGGDGDSNSNSTTPTPTPPTTVSVAQLEGTIESISGNTISLNGYQVDLSTAQIVYLDQAWNQQLEVDMRVRVDFNNGVATLVNVNPLLAGTLIQSTVRSTSWMVNGIPVTGSDSSQWQDGDSVMVFGHYQSDGSVNAQHLTELQVAQGFVEVEGRVTALNSAAKQFTLQTLRVDYNGAREVDSELSEGAWVEVIGTLAGSDLSATEVDVEDIQPSGNSGESEGLVQFFNPQTGLLELDRQRQYYVSESTRFENGSKSDLIQGAVVEVEYRYSDPNYQATVIEFEDDANPPTNPAPIHSEFQLSGLADWDGTTLLINNIPFVIDAKSRFDDNLNINNLDGRWVELDGLTQSGQNLVREIEAQDELNQMDLAGTVTNGVIWGYRSSDNSLQTFNGRWVELECLFDGTYLYQCRQD